MQKTSEVVEKFIQLFQSDKRFENVRFLKAFPAEEAPNRLSFPVVALSLGDVEISDEALGESVKTGTCSLHCRIYSDCNAEREESEQLFADLCSCAFVYNLLSVSAKPLEYDNDTGFMLLDAVFTFHDEFDFGE